MRMRQQHVGDVGRGEPVLSQHLDHVPAHVDAASVHQRDPAVPAQERDRAPAEPAVTHGLAGIAGDEKVDVVAARAQPHAPGPVLRRVHHGLNSLIWRARAAAAPTRNERSVPLET